MIAKFLFFKLELSNSVINKDYESYDKIQNFSSVSLKLGLLGQKNTAAWAVNTTLAKIGYKRNICGCRSYLLRLEMCLTQIVTAQELVARGELQCST